MKASRHPTFIFQDFADSITASRIVRSNLSERFARISTDAHFRDIGPRQFCAPMVWPRIGAVADHIFTVFFVGAPAQICGAIIETVTVPMTGLYARHTLPVKRFTNQGMHASGVTLTISKQCHVTIATPLMPLERLMLPATTIVCETAADFSKARGLIVRKGGYYLPATTQAGGQRTGIKDLRSTKATQEVAAARRTDATVEPHERRSVSPRRRSAMRTQRPATGYTTSRRTSQSASPRIASTMQPKYR